MSLVANKWNEWFRNDDDVDNEVHEQVVHARNVIETTDMDYFASLLKWLDKEADRPLRISQDIGMVEAVVRVNTIKEIREKIRDDISRSRALLEQIAEVSNG
jgi:hypothetical protein